MQFFDLETFPSGDHDETWYKNELGYLQGEAERCPACGDFVSSLAWLPPCRVYLELPGKNFADFVFAVSGGDVLVSQKFHDIYHARGLSGIKAFDAVTVLGVKSRRRNLSLPPPYYRVIVTRGKPNLDVIASGFEWVTPPTCSHCRSGNFKRWKRLVLEPGSWTGEDIFHPLGLGGTIMVSERFKRACDENGITNAIFTPAEEAGHDSYPWEKPTPSEHDETGRG
jgi:hypothetical protein